MRGSGQMQREYGVPSVALVTSTENPKGPFNGVRGPDLRYDSPMYLSGATVAGKW
jgi:hypothetical protein